MKLSYLGAMPSILSITRNLNELNVMTIKVEFRGPLESHGVQTTYRIDCKNQDKARDVLDRLLQQNRGLEEIFSDLESLERNTMVLLNEKDVALFDGLDTRLNDGDHLLILPLIHGG